MDIFTKTYLSIINEEQQKTPWYCQTCDQYFRTSKELNEHKKVHPHICKYCGEEFKTGQKLGCHISRCNLNPNFEKNRQALKLANKNKNFHHSEQTKQKISQIRKQYIKQHPESFAWRRADKFKSKPCEDLKQFFKNNGINFYQEYKNIQEFAGKNYAIDIAFPNQKIAIEVNGTQHYNRDGTLTPYFQQRHDILQKAGWKVQQIPYNKAYKQEVRQSLLKLIKDNVDFTYDYSQQIKQFLRQKQLQHICPICGGEKKDKYAKCCNKCERQKRKQNIPSKQQLQKDYEQLHNYSAIGRKYNRSHTVIRNWFKNYHLI